MLRRYGRAQFLKDAVRLGIAPDAAFSRIELRRRRDRLMHVHHPDRGGDVKKAARINAIYTRMVVWLDARAASAAETRPEVDAGRRPPGFAGRFNAGAARVWGLAAVAVATYAAFRRKQGP